MKKITSLVVCILSIMTFNNGYAYGVHHTEDPYKEQKLEYIRSITLMPNESYLTYVVKIKRAFNLYIQQVSDNHSLNLIKPSLKDILGTMIVQNQSMIINNNLFKKDKLEFSVEKEKNYELVLKHATQSECQVIIHQYLDDKFTSYILVNDKQQTKVQHIQIGESNSDCEKDNTIKLSIF